jgi:hypothetical protein
MGKRIFLAGATSAIGKRLTPLLLQAGHHVTGTTRSPARAEGLARSGIEPVVVDVFDADALHRAVVAARPEVVIHQLTALPPGLDPALMEAALKANARVREEGTRNLVRAALAADVRRLIAQSLAWVYAPGPQPFTEASPLYTGAVDALDVTRRGVVMLEESVLNAAPIEALRADLRAGHRLCGTSRRPAAPCGCGRLCRIPSGRPRPAGRLQHRRAERRGRDGKGHCGTWLEPGIPPDGKPAGIKQKAAAVSSSRQNPCR